jgi:hypothetical protein
LGVENKLIFDINLFILENLFIKTFYEIFKSFKSIDVKRSNNTQWLKLRKKVLAEKNNYYFITIFSDSIIDYNIIEKSLIIRDNKSLQFTSLSIR